MAKELFKEGAMVEVSLEHEGFRGSWYTATILRPHTKKTNNNHLYLEFHTLISEDKATKSLREFVDEQNLSSKEQLQFHNRTSGALPWNNNNKDEVFDGFAY
ncbi:hypothetical protein LguiB_020028 [Lonicera macranthoides]